MRPSKTLSLLDDEFDYLEDRIKPLEEENARLRKENSRLLDQGVQDADRMARLTLQMALSGCLPVPGTPGHAACGYSDEVATNA